MSERRPINRPPQHSVMRTPQPRPAQHRPTQKRANSNRQSVRKQQSRMLPIMVAAAVVIVAIVLILIFALGGDSDKLRKGVDIVHAMASQINTVHSVVDYTADTDPNKRLGDKGWYVNKTDWRDTRTDGEYTLEVYTDETKAKERAEYLETFYGTVLCNYVVYRDNVYVMRVDAELSDVEFNQYTNALRRVAGMNDNDFKVAVGAGSITVSNLTNEELEYQAHLESVRKNAEAVTPFNDMLK